jgi:hypothetical protein
MEESAKLFINGIKSSLNSDLLQQWVSELEDEIGGCKIMAIENQLFFVNFDALFFFSPRSPEKQFPNHATCRLGRGCIFFFFNASDFRSLCFKKIKNKK